MRRGGTMRVVGLTLVAILLAGGFLASSTPPARAALSSHAPIMITSDSGFTAANGVTGGSGSAGDPYVIEGWDIDASSTVGITIATTTAHFAIRNVTVHSSTGSYHGIDLVSLSNGTVDNATITGCYSGIAITSGTDVAVRDSNATHGSGEGISLWFARRVEILNSSTFDFVTGISVGQSQDLLIKGVNATYTHQDDLLVSSSTNVTVENGFFAHNGRYAVEATGSSGVYAFHNAFGGSLIANGYDDNPYSGDQWDAGYPTGGNSWDDYNGWDHCSGHSQNVCPDSDGIGDSPYYLSVSGSDRYPIVPPNTPPVARLSASPTSAPANATISLSASASTDAQDPAYVLQVRWDWNGDGVWDTGWSTAKGTSHRYPVAGTYPIRVEVMDGGGLTDNATATVSIYATPPLAVDASALTPTTGVAPFWVLFTANASGGAAPYAFHWSFGDGGSASVANTTHQFLFPGSFTVILNVTDSVGTYSVTTFSVTAYRVLVITATPTAAQGMAPLPVFFVGTLYGGVEPYTILWTFGDGATSSDLVVNHTYASAGRYSVVLEVSDASGQTARQTVAIRVTSIVATSSGISLATLPWPVYSLGLAALVVVPGIVLGRRRGPGKRRTWLLALGLALAVAGAVVAAVPGTSSTHISEQTFGASTGTWFLSDPIDLPAGLGLDLAWTSNWNLTVGLLPQAAAQDFTSGANVLRSLAYGSGTVGEMRATIPQTGAYVLAIHLAPAAGTWSLNAVLTASLPFTYAFVGFAILGTGAAVVLVGFVYRPKRPAMTSES